MEFYVKFWIKPNIALANISFLVLNVRANRLIRRKGKEKRRREGERRKKEEGRRKKKRRRKAKVWKLCVRILVWKFGTSPLFKTLVRMLVWKFYWKILV